MSATVMHTLPLADPLFDSLRTDYPGFDKWFAAKAREGRECWMVS